MSETARSFVSACLTVDPEARPTAEEMLQHSWLTAEVPHFVEAADGTPTDLLPHVRKAFNARRTCMFRSLFVRETCTVLIAPLHAVRKAVFSMMAMKRMSMMAQHLTPEQHQLNEDVYKYKQESEKESLEHADVLHHHNADVNSQHEATLLPSPHVEATEQPKVEDEASGTQGSSAGAPSDQTPPVPAKESKDVTEKLAAVSLTASAKVSGAAKRA